MRRITTVALVVALALAGAACGGDDDAATEDTAATNDGGGNDDGATTDIGDLVDDDCEFLLAGAFQNPLAAAQSGDEDFEDASSRFDKIADNAPDEIKDAMQVIADSWTELAELWKGIDLKDPSSLRDPEVQAKFQQMSEIADEDYQAASQEIASWMQDNCTGAASN